MENVVVLFQRFLKRKSKDKLQIPKQYKSRNVPLIRHALIRAGSHKRYLKFVYQKRCYILSLYKGKHRVL